ARALPIENGTAGSLQHFQRPYDALAVAGLQRHRSTRVLLHEDLMQAGRALFMQFIAPAVTNGSGDIGHVGHAVDQGPEIQPRTADEDRTPLQAVADQLRHIAHPLARRIGDRRVNMPVEMMWRAYEFGWTGARGQNIQDRIALHG